MNAPSFARAAALVALGACALVTACSGASSEDDGTVRVAITASSRLDAGAQRPGQLPCVSDDDTACGEVTRPSKRPCPETAPPDNLECFYADQTCNYAGPCSTLRYQCIGQRGGRWTLVSGPPPVCEADAGTDG